MTARDNRVKAIGLAGLAIEEFEQALEAATVKYHDATAQIINVVGQSQNEAGRIAMARTLSIQVSITDINEKCQEIKRELNRYSGGM